MKADPAATLKRLTSAAREIGLKSEHRGWAKRVTELMSMWRAMVEEALSRKYEDAVNPARLVKAADKLLLRERIVAAGQGVHIVYAYDFLAVYEPRSFLAATQLGSMSFALPAAIAASLAKPSISIIAFVGDGELMMTVQGLEH